MQQGLLPGPDFMLVALSVVLPRSDLPEGVAVRDCLDFELV